MKQTSLKLEELTIQNRVQMSTNITCKHHNKTGKCHTEGLQIVSEEGENHEANKG